MFYESSLPTFLTTYILFLSISLSLSRFFVSLFHHRLPFPFFCYYNGFFLCSPLTPVGLVDCIYFIYIPLSPISHDIYVSHIFCSLFSFFCCYSGFWQFIDSRRLSGLHILYIYIPLSHISHHLYIPYILFFLFLFCSSGFFPAVHWQSHL